MSFFIFGLNTISSYYTYYIYCVINIHIHDSLIFPLFSTGKERPGADETGREGCPEEGIRGWEDGEITCYGANTRAQQVEHKLFIQDFRGSVCVDLNELHEY